MVLRSPPVLSSALFLVYVAIGVASAMIASSKEMCGHGDLQPSCVMFAVGSINYGLIAIGVATTIATLIGLALRRRLPGLVKGSAVLYVAALLSLSVPVVAAGNKLGGAIVVIAVLPFTLMLLVAASVSIVVWLGRAVAGKLSCQADRKIAI